MPPRSLRRLLLLGLLAVALALAGCDDGGPRRVHCPEVPPDAGTVLFGEVYRADGGSGEDSYIEARGPNGMLLHGKTQDGTECFALSAVAGDWTVVASQDGWAGSSTATLSEGEHVRIAIVMQRVHERPF